MNRAGVTATRPGPRVLRWLFWLAAGIAFGLLAGFVAALSQPRDDTARPEAQRSPGADDAPGSSR